MSDLSCPWRSALFLLFFFFNDTATTEIYTLSLHDALPISDGRARASGRSLGNLGEARERGRPAVRRQPVPQGDPALRSEEHTSELQSRPHLVCRLLLENTTEITADMAHIMQKA